MKQEQHDEIMDIINKRVEEGLSGRLYCPNSYILRIGKILGWDYKIWNKYKKERFRQDIINAYQMGFFKTTYDYHL